MPIKVYELAKELHITNTEALGLLDKLGIKRLSPGSDLDDPTAERVRTAYTTSNGTGSANGARPADAPSARPSADGPAGQRPAGAPPRTAPLPGKDVGAGGPAASGELIVIPINVTIKELADRLKVSASEIQKVLMGKGVLAGLNQRLAPDAVQFIAQKLNRNVRIGEPTPAPAAPVAAPTAQGPSPVVGAPAPNRNATPGTPAAPRPANRSVAVQGRTPTMVPRPPVVTIMGHVDHGKTTLLDTIRKAQVAEGEAGGITQHIGAYQVEVNGQRLTFLDTPGHAAFSAMRQRGAKVTDIVILVVAANDSVKPQTEEAIRITKEAGVPMVVAVNKVDLEESNPDQVLTDLTRYEVFPEAYGGDVQTVNISAKTGFGVDTLLETVLLVAEAVVEPKADPHAPAQGTVIEAKQEKGRGPVVSVLVQQGTLKQGDMVVAGPQFGRVRVMNDDRGNKIAKAGPSTPVEIIGLNGVPEPGDTLEVAKDEKEARAIAQRREIDLRESRLSGSSRTTLEGLYMQLLKGPVKELNVVIKGDVQGSVQAVRDSIIDLGNDEVRVRVLDYGVGPISENDVLLAASDKDAEEKNSLVVGFNVPMGQGAEKKSETEHVQVKTFTIIYELIDAVKEALVALLEPIYEEAELGKAEVRALFRLPGGRTIAGAYVTSGIVRRNAKARLFRGKDLLYTGDIDTLKRFKEDAREVASDYECGLTLRGWNDVIAGDLIECFEMRQIPREL